MIIDVSRLVQCCIGHGYLWWKYIDYERTYFLDDTLHGE